MCAIIEKPVGETLAAYKLRNASYNNEDGLGWMYIDPTTNEMVVGREFFSDSDVQADRLIALMEEHRNIHVVYHLRYGTHGTNSLENVHPFQVLNKVEHGRDVWFMHNGIINISSDAEEDKDLSDTQIFNKYVLQPILGTNPELLYTWAFQLLIEEYTSGSRLLFMDDTGHIIKTGTWQTNEQCNVSNNSYFNTSYKTRSSTYTPPAITSSSSSSSTTSASCDAWGKLVETATPEVKGTTEELPRYLTGNCDMISVGGQLRYVDSLTLRDVTWMSVAEIEAFVEEYPEEAADMLNEAAMTITYSTYGAYA